jgi:hypothetical protein
MRNILLVHFHCFREVVMKEQISATLVSYLLGN